MGEQPHKRLVVWQVAMELVEHVYRLSERFPSEERFGLTAQMRRAAISIASNIAEGAARRTTPETLQAFYVARGSVSELDTQLDIAHRLRLIDAQQRDSAIITVDRIGRLLSGLIASKRRS